MDGALVSAGSHNAQNGRLQENQRTAPTLVVVVVAILARSSVCIAQHVILQSKIGWRKVKKYAGLAQENGFSSA